MAERRHVWQLGNWKLKPLNKWASHKSHHRITLPVDAVAAIWHFYLFRFAQSFNNPPNSVQIQFGCQKCLCARPFARSVGVLGMVVWGGSIGSRQPFWFDAALSTKGKTTSRANRKPCLKVNSFNLITVDFIAPLSNRYEKRTEDAPKPEDVAPVQLSSAQPRAAIVERHRMRYLKVPESLKNH